MSRVIVHQDSDKPTSEDNDDNTTTTSHSYSIAVLRSLRAAGVKFLRYSALDLCNNVRCKAVPIDYLYKNILSESSLDDAGVSFATSCLAGLPSFADSIIPETGLHAASGMVIFKPAMETLRVLPYAPISALVLCNLQDAATNKISDYCCRGVLQSMLQRCQTDYGIAFNVGAELEFNLNNAHDGHAVDDSHYAASTTLNQQETFITDVYDQLTAQDIEVELVHAESAPGQLEIVLKYQDNALRLADHVFLARDTVQAVAHKHGLMADFRPKAYADQAGNGLHLHISLRDLWTTTTWLPSSGSNRRHGPLSKMEHMQFIEGILQQMSALLAFTLPSVNSFQRVGGGCWTGHECSWGMQDKEAAIKVVSEECNHFEFKLCDSKANLYLSLTALIAAGLDGIDNQKVLRASSSDAISSSRNSKLPASLPESLKSLNANQVLSSAIPTRMLQAYTALKHAEVL